jgi:hypothetical protein
VKTTYAGIDRHTLKDTFRLVNRTSSHPFVSGGTPTKHRVKQEQLVAGLRSHRARNDAAAVSREGVEFVAAHGTSEEGMVPSLAAEAAFGDLAVAPAFAALAR